MEYPFQANGASAADKLKAGKMESEHTKAATAMGMEGCGLPIVVHGDRKINQSFACQNYLASIGPNFPKITPEQQAVDNMFQGYLEDCMGLAAGVILSGGDPALVPKIMERVLTHLSKYIPKDGFVHGKAAPTTSDLVILVLTQALIPFGATLGEGAAECYGKFPTAVALGERAAAFPAVAKWLTNEYCCLKKPPRAARTTLPKPVLHYFDVSGRGELCKLIAAVGGLEMDVVEYPFQANGASAADKLKAGKMESEHTKAATAMGMEGCGLPIVVHGDLKINQSFACQNYLASIGPNFPKITPQQQAVDNMFQGYLEDCMGLAAGVVLSGGDPALVPKIMERVLTHLSKYIPKDGFVHGKAAPTTSDLVILVLTQALIPFGATLGEGAAECYGKFPTAVALGERAAAFPAVAKWLTNEKCCLKKPPKAARN